MRYELILRAVSESSGNRDGLGASLLRRGFLETTADHFELALPGGVVRLAPSAAGGWDAQADAQRTSQSLTLDFPLGLSDADGRRAIDAAFDLAQENGLELFDPQMGECLHEKDRERVFENWRRSHAFQFEVAGRTDLGVDLPSAPAPKTSSNTRIKILLLLVGLCVLAVLVLRSCLSQLLDRAMNPPAAGAKP